FEARFGLHRAPVREHANDARAGASRDFECTLGEARLVGEGVLRGEHILLEARIDLGCIGQHTFEQRRGDRDDLQSRTLADGDGATVFFIARIDDVLADQPEEFGAGHADLLHGSDGDFDIGREFVGDGGDRVVWHESSIIVRWPGLLTVSRWCRVRASASWPRSRWEWTACCASTSAKAICRRPSTSSALRCVRWKTASRSTPRTPACLRRGARSRRATRICTASSLILQARSWSLRAVYRR